MSFEGHVFALSLVNTELDRQVDRLFGAKRRMTTEEQRQTALFKTYRQLINYEGFVETLAQHTPR